MRRTQVEMWALRVLDQLSRPAGLEDQNVELKKQLPDPAEGARLIAGLCNAARGEPSMILVGVNERTREIVGAPEIALNNWWQGAVSRFDGPHPTMVDALIALDDGLTVQALVFDSDSSSAPYVVKNAAGGPISHEVPWREATILRSARRVDLLRSLVPAILLPDVEVLDGNVQVYEQPGRESPDPYLDWYLGIDLYLTPRGDATVIFPRHRCSATATIPEWGIEVQFPHIYFSHHRQREGVAAGFLTITPSEIIVEGPCRFSIRGSVETPKGGIQPTDPLDLEVSMVASLSENPLVIQQQFRFVVQQKYWGLWTHETNTRNWNL